MRTTLFVLFLLTCSALNITITNITNTNGTMSDGTDIELINTIVGSVIGGFFGCIIIGICFVYHCCK